ncbi:MAG: ABC transporter permease subunit [Candidatus Odinarchaeia archaeon]
MNFKSIMILAKKEIKEIILRSKYIYATVIVMPLIIGVIIPSVMSFLLLQVVYESSPINGGFSIPFFPTNLNFLTANELFYIYFINIYSTLMNLIIPIMLPVYIAADSFAGEKERKTIEPLLASPLSDSEILLGKTLTSLIPTLIASIFSIVLGIIVVNVIGFMHFNFIIYPLLPTILLYIIGIPILSLLSVFSMILVSSKVQKVREATQLGGVVIIPVLALFFLSLTGIVSLDVFTVIIYLLILAVITILIIYVGFKLFKRQNLVEYV